MRRNAFQQTADGFKQQYEEQAKQVDVLKDALSQLEAKINEAETKKDLLIARSRRAKAETQIRTTLTGLDAGGALASFDRMEDKVNQQEARASALAEIDQDSTDQRFALLESESQLDDQLAELKAKKGLGSGGDAKALGAGSDTEEATP
jgi:phage shock protein A